MADFLAGLGELTLKGSNIKSFERALKENAKTALRQRGVEHSTVRLHSGRLYITCADEVADKALDALSHLIGIANFARVTSCQKTLDAIVAAAVNEAALALATLPPDTVLRFKAESKREDKSFPKSSYDICCAVGDALSKSFGSRVCVDLHHPALTIKIEVRDKAYLYSLDDSAPRAVRGLPVGVSGKAMVLLSGGLDSPVAAFRLLKRGLSVDCVYFHSHPYTSIEAEEKVEKLAQVVSAYAPRLFLNVVSFTEPQMKIRADAPEDWSTLMLRVCMMKAASLVAAAAHSECLATGESLGQVASQTLDNLAATAHFATLPVLRPLIAFDKEEIIKTAREIGTYETSILPFEDCCVLFTPRHPILHASVERAQEFFDKLNENNAMDTLIAQAVAKRKILRFEGGKLISTVTANELATEPTE